MKKLILTLIAIALAQTWACAQATNTNMVVIPASPVTMQAAPVTASQFVVSNVYVDVANNTITICYVGLTQKTIITGVLAAAIINKFTANNSAAIQTYITANPPQ